MQLYTFEQAGIIHNTWYNKVYSCAIEFTPSGKENTLRMR